MGKRISKRLDLKSQLRQAKTEEERQAIIEGLPHEVGFAKPPKATRFKPGHSGNPKGRRKGSRNLGSIMVEALDERVEVTENGRRRKKSKGEIAVVQLANKAASGDMKAVMAVVDFLRKTGQLNGGPVAQEIIFDSQDLQAASQLLSFYTSDDSGDAQGGAP